MHEFLTLNAAFGCRFCAIPVSSRITLTQAATTLGVTREHLSRVLNGHRESRSLTSRFNALQQAAETSHQDKP